MTLSFFCPAGHKIHCSPTQAGRAAKCPQCGVRFRVPTAEEAAQAPGSTIIANALPTDTGSSPAAADAAPKEPQIEFLCPNGHRLHGPTSLQGRPGQCPECGSKFRVPSYDEVSDDEVVGQNISVSTGEGDYASNLSLEAPGQGQSEFAFLEEITHATDAAPAATGPETVSAGVTPGATGLPWSALLSKLWTSKSPGSVIEICLSDGEIMIPDRLARSAPGGPYGLVAVKNANGTYTVTAIAWTSVVRIVVRGLKALPEELFD